jgi:CDP-diacylglycerol--glycerol-3-phosphate 3-phosphatidyltransferase
MIVRGCARCASRARVLRHRPSISTPRFQYRSYATPHGAQAAQAHSGGAGLLAPLVSELDRMAPSFDIRGEQIRVLKTPAEFYETLKVRKDDALHGSRDGFWGLMD